MCVFACMRFCYGVCVRVRAYILACEYWMGDAISPFLPFFCHVGFAKRFFPIYFWIACKGGIIRALSSYLGIEGTLPRHRVSYRYFTSARCPVCLPACLLACAFSLVRSLFLFSFLYFSLSLSASVSFPLSSIAIKDSSCYEKNKDIQKNIIIFGSTPTSSL